MTDPTLSANQPAQGRDAEYNQARIYRLLSELEQELVRMPADIPHVASLREEISAAKNALSTPDAAPGGYRERLHSVRDRLHTVSERVEGEMLRDGPYLTELAKILGLV
jgi:hypothetical protein